MRSHDIRHSHVVRIARGAVLGLLLASIGGFGPSHSQPASGKRSGHVPDAILVKFGSDLPDSVTRSARTSLRAAREHRFASGAELWRLPPGLSVENAMRRLSHDPNVEYVEPDDIGFLLSVPVDQYYYRQWNLMPSKINAEEAWDITQGSSDVVVAAPDSGINYAHPDLAGNIWINAGEDLNSNGVVDGTNSCPTPNGDFNCVDDDGNGYTDDIRGWDFAASDNDPMDASGHGTAVAGIIGARTNIGGELSSGMAGINWFVKLMPLRCDAGSAVPQEVTVSNLAAAIDYAVDKGADIISLSIGFYCDQPTNTCHQTLKAAVSRARDRDVIVISGAGNNNQDIDTANNWLNPTSFNLDNQVGVAGTDISDNKWYDSQESGSAFGHLSVDIAGPATNNEICTLFNGDYYDYCKETGGGFGGTSAATPHVAGVAALIRSLSPGIPYELIKKQLLEPSSIDAIHDFRTSGPTPITTGGRVNAYKAVADHESVSPAQVTNLSTQSRTKNSITVRWTAPGDDGTSGTASLYQLRYSLAPINASNWLLATKVTGLQAPSAPGTTETFTVGGLSCSTTYYFALKAFDEWGNGTMSNVLTQATKAPVCTISYCSLPSERCDWTGTCTPGGCCAYECYYDESCAYPDPPPPC